MDHFFSVVGDSGCGGVIEELADFRVVQAGQAAHEARRVGDGAARHARLIRPDDFNDVARCELSTHLAHADGQQAGRAAT